MDDGMNDDAAASRTTPSEQSQKKPGGAADSGLPEAHFQGFRGIHQSSFHQGPAPGRGIRQYSPRSRAISRAHNVAS